MMSKLFNFLLLATLTWMIAPEVVLAQSVVTPIPVAAPPTTFCGTLDMVSGKIKLQVQEKDAAILEFMTGRDALLMERSKERAAAISGKRSEWDSRREEEYRLLESKASTTLHTSAIKDFESAIDLAVSKRRSVIDLAANEIEAAVNKEIEARKGLIDQARTSLLAGVNKAETKAKTDCANGISDDKAQTDFVALLAQARLNYKKSVSLLENRKDMISPLFKKQEQNITKAIEQFRIETEQAKTVLLKALEVR